MTHTPGPWGWDYPLNWDNKQWGDPVIKVENEDGESICSLPYGHSADAALITAAPELLERLKESRDAIASLPNEALGVEVAGDGCSHWFIKDELLGNIDTAIAKAEAAQ